MGEAKCGCGKGIRYVTVSVDGVELWSCNKYKRCMTREEMEEELNRQRRELSAYKVAIQHLGEYFEEKREAVVAQKKVYQVLGNLEDRLSK